MWSRAAMGSHKTRTAALWFVASPPRDVDSVCLSVCLSGTYAAGTLANLFSSPAERTFRRRRTREGERLGPGHGARLLPRNGEIG